MLRRWLPAAAVLLAVLLLWPILLPFLLAFALAAAVEPLVGRLCRLGLRRWLAAGAVLLSLLTVLGGGLWLLLQRLLYEAGQFLRQLPGLLSSLSQDSWLEHWRYALVVAAPVELQETLAAALDSLLQKSLTLPERLYEGAADLVTAAAAGLPGFLLAVTTFLLAAFYCSADFPRLCAGLWALVPPGRRPWLARLGQSARQACASWLRVQGRMLGIIFLVLAAGLLLLRVPYALLAAAVGALVDALPFLGSAVLLVPWAVLSLLQGQPVRCAGLLALLAALCLLRSFLEPRFYGRQAGVSPLLTLAAVYAGFRLFGVWGMLLAPLAVSMAASLLRALRQPGPPGAAPSA